MFKKRTPPAVNAHAPFTCKWWTKQSDQMNTPPQIMVAHLRRLENQGKLFHYADNPYAVAQFFPTENVTIAEIINELAKI